MRGVALHVGAGLVGVLGCGGCTSPRAPDSPAAASEDTGSVGPASYPAPAATLDPADVPGRMAEALAGGVVDPWGLVDAWFDLFAHADASCPAGNLYDLPVNYGGCDTAAGWHFAGTASFQEHEGPGQVSFDMSQDCEVTEPDATRYYGSGSWSVNAPMGAGDFGVKASGVYGWPSAGGLLGTGYSVWVGMWGTLTDRGGSLSLEGVLAVGDTPLSFEGVTADTETCPGGTGTLGLRDPSGGWFALTLDATCDGCGTLSYEGEDLGAACADLAPAWRASLAALRPTELPWR